MKKYFPILLYGLFCLFQCGCSGHQPHDLRKQSSVREQFHVPESFQLVYENILKKFDQCASSPRHRQINTLAGVARIMASDNGLLVEILKVTEGQTRVDVYARSASARNRIPEYGAWGRNGCPK